MDFITFQSPIKRSGTVIWYASIQDKALKSNEYFQHVVSQLTASEQTSVKRFIFEPDQKRALLSILLQRALIHKEFDFTNKHDFQISRTQEGKPYLVSTRKNVGFWNYNVSHHGDFVCIAADHESLIGVDIVDITTRQNGPTTVKSYVSMFSEQLTANEVKIILSEKDEDSQYNMFYLYWSLKEAFIKAVGQGLGYELSSVEFTVYPDQNLAEPGNRKIDGGYATVALHGVLQNDWNLDHRHVVSIARGPLHAALTTFQRAAWKQVLSPPILTPSITVATALATGKVEKKDREVDEAEEMLESSSHLTREDCQVMSVEGLCDTGHVMECDVPRVSMCCACGSIN